MRKRLAGMAIAAVGGAALAWSALAVASNPGMAGWHWGRLPVGAAPPPVAAANGMSAAKVALGRRLFYDPALSRDGTLACAGCHEQGRGFADGQRVHVGVTGEMGIRNVPGLANVAWRSPLTWTDAKIDTLEQQALVPMTGERPVEMGMKGAEAEIARRLVADPCYRALFAAAFPGRARGGAAIGLGEVTAALASFQRTLISTDMPYDRYRRGQKDALSAPAQRGEAQFHAAGCVDCHSGADLTDNRFHYAGTTALGTSPGYNEKAPVAGEALIQDFRTPPLRNVAVTGPWLHDGSAATMEDAIRRHAATLLGKVTMPDMLAFMEALTDRSFLTEPKFGKPVGRCGVRETG
ncbi:cytochrome-c peroxidase [Sphingobium aquiterrae]|uniref:cytochrome-c peroxidase n=1 Tax=Sphingobium aquiterrae TaxID=2038656 RepID=UPI003019AD2C